MSRFGDFLEEHGIDLQQVVRESAALEHRTSEDRELMVKRASARRAKKGYADADAPKPKGLGRGVSVRTVRDAMDGRPVSRLCRKKLVRALNVILGHQSKDPTDARLFDDTRKSKDEQEG
ncbi:MAG: hypothetical protein ACFB9M_16675 [Myxococcota bacterium]